MTELVTWRGTPGVGDFMWALNCSHLHSWRSKTPINLEMHWSHDENHLHHFEDPETIIERMQYIHNFYDRKNDVRISHVINAKGRYSFWKYEDDIKLLEDGSKVQVARNIEKTRFYFQSGIYSDKRGNKAPENDWLFRSDSFQKTISNKIVFWRPTFNAETPRTWKRGLTNRDWEIIIDKLKSHGFQMVELTYRTPIREAMWHIATCRQVICYDGMWHYVAKNFCKPLLVVSEEGITKYHTKYAVRSSHNIKTNANIWFWVDNPKIMLKHSQKKADNFREKMREIRQ
jgi:hypothetical protein